MLKDNGGEFHLRWKWDAARWRHESFPREKKEDFWLIISEFPGNEKKKKSSEARNRDDPIGEVAHDMTLAGVHQLLLQLWLGVQVFLVLATIFFRLVARGAHIGVLCACVCVFATWNTTPPHPHPPCHPMTDMHWCFYKWDSSPSLSLSSSSLFLNP